MKTQSRDALLLKHNFESLYIFPGLCVLHLTQGMNRKEKKLTRNDVPYTKNDQLVSSFLIAYKQ